MNIYRDHVVASDTNYGHGGPLVVVNPLTLSQLLILPDGWLSRPRLHFCLQMRLPVLV